MQTHVSVINGKRTKEGADLEVLQRPTGEEGRLTRDRLRSEGRFLAVRDAFLDPAGLPEGAPITIIGTVKGLTTRQLDESDDVYPVLEAKHITDWKTLAAQTGDKSIYSGFYYSPYFWGGFYPYRGFYPYSSCGRRGFYRPYLYFGSRSFSPGPPSPLLPPRNVHPGLRGR